MTDFQIRSDNVDVEQIMRQIRARIREKRGVDYTEDEIKELARVKLEKFLDPTGVRSDLLAQFREYHQQHGEATLPDLRHSYDMLVLKLLSLVQDGDPPLASDIDRSRTAIWEILSDQRKFIDANLMAGASL